MGPWPSQWGIFLPAEKNPNTLQFPSLCRQGEAKRWGPSRLWPLGTTLTFAVTDERKFLLVSFQTNEPGRVFLLFSSICPPSAPDSFQEPFISLPCLLPEPRMICPRA